MPEWRANLYEVKETKNFGFDPDTGLPLSPGDPIVDVTDTPFVFLTEGKRENTYFFAQETSSSESWTNSFL